MVGRVAGTRLHLISVDEPGSDANDTNKYLTEIRERLEGAGIEVDHVVLEGTVVDSIEDRAKQVEADLIVMATHGRSGLERLRLGSVAEGLVSRGIAPMLLFHPEPDGATSVPESIHKLVVALDQSALANDILDPLETLGKVTGVSSYTLVHVADGKGAGKPGWAPLSTIRARAKEGIAPIRERLGDVEVDVQVVMASNPSDGILGVAEEAGADLIAMTTHGMTGLKPTLVGSVAAQVLRKWSGPLLVHRPSED